jgi:copper resistance protein C
MKYFAATGTVLLTLCLLTLSAHAHSPFVGSMPEDGATLRANEAPDQIELRFGHPLRITQVVLEAAEGDKQRLATSGGVRAEHTFELPQLRSGRYSVQWRGIASDGHVMSGSIEFRVKGE